MELWTGLLAYNLVRLRMLQAALSVEPAEEAEEAEEAEGQAEGAGRPALPRSARTMSHTRARDVLARGWLTNAVMPATAGVRHQANAVMLGVEVGHRPGRREPRAVKRRQTPIALLMRPRTGHPEHRKQAA